MMRTRKWHFYYCALLCLTLFHNTFVLSPYAGHIRLQTKKLPTKHMKQTYTKEQSLNHTKKCYKLLFKIWCKISSLLSGQAEMYKHFSWCINHTSLGHRGDLRSWDLTHYCGWLLVISLCAATTWQISQTGNIRVPGVLVLLTSWLMFGYIN